MAVPGRRSAGAARGTPASDAGAHPGVCTLTSEIFYDGRLEPEAQNARQRLGGTPPLAGSGLRHGPVAHRGMDVLNSGNRFNVAVSRALAQASPEDDRELTHA